MKVYIMCVGTRDPYWVKGERISFEGLVKRRGRDYDRGDLIEGPILSFFSVCKPRANDRIYLLSTAEGDKVRDPTITGGEETKEKLKELYGLKDENLRHWPLSGINPSLFEEVMPSMKEKVIDIIEENGSDAEYIINVSPGTPQMEAVWYVLVNSGVIKAKLYTFDPSTSKIREVVISPLFEEEVKNTGITLFERFSFKASSDIFDKLSRETVDEKRKTICEIFRDLFKVYSDWIVFKYGKALEGIKRLKGSPILRKPDFKVLVETLSEQEKKLEELSKEAISPEARALDLLNNGELKFEIGDYVDSIWLFHASCEEAIVDRAVKSIQRITGQYVNPNEFDIAMRNLRISRLLDPILTGREIPQFLDGETSSIILDGLERRGHRVGFNPSLRREIEGLRRKRNRVLHRGEKVSRESAEKGRKTVREVLKEQFGFDDAKIDAYPFSKKELLKIGEFAKRII